MFGAGNWALGLTEAASHLPVFVFNCSKCVCVFCSVLVGEGDDILSQDGGYGAPPPKKKSGTC